MAYILVIDDDPLVREMMALCLPTEHIVITAADGERAVEIAEARQIDLIICDVSMPHMDGFSVFDRFQSLDRMADVPFVFLSGSSDQRMLRQGMALGADDFLTKPVSVQELIRVVDSRLRKRAHRQALLKNAIDELRVNITTALPHELRTAIMIMEGYAHLVLEESDKIDPLQREMVQAISENAARLRHMAEKYLWYLRVYLPDTAINDPVTPDADRVIQHCASEVAQRFGRVSDLKIDQEIAALQVRDDYLRRVIEEVVENAFKFSAVGTPVSILAAIKDQEYVLSVCNTGPQISPEQIERIGAFMQFDRATHEQPGTGLGLTIATRLIKLSGGRFHITSQQGKTYVTIALPLLHVPLTCEVSVAC